MTATDSSPVPDFVGLLRLDDRRYVVAGAGVGMGRQTAHALAQAGAAAIVCVDVDADRAKEIAEEVGTVAHPWTGDVTTREGAAALGTFVDEELGGIDGFVDIIGMAKWESILDMSDETFDWQIDINLRHAFLLSQELGRRMAAAGGGSMVFVGSVSGLTGAPMHAAYGAAKAGLSGWVRSLAQELGPKNIRANAVAPGSILSPRMDAVFTDDLRRANSENAPLGRMGATSEVASAALFLASDLSSYITGRTLVVDGGVDVKFQYPSTL
ncbi:SDR family oxidoreductase [Pseudonocardia ailaonensis]|uniref:SDR family oxidoreductase n=1 Tax=Pseudonocardia ailaonensis TaxID=367279 RepID=A0ABN2MZW3_9PSEU